MAVVPNRTYTTLTSRGLRHEIFPMRLYHKAKKLGAWDPRDIDLTVDKQNWPRLPEEDKERLRPLLFAFQAAEEAVTLDLLPLIMTVAREGRLEEEMFLTTFLWEEAKHTEFFRRFLDEVIQTKEDLHSPRVVEEGERDLFGEELLQEMHRLLTDPSPENQARASILYNMILEGVLAETGYYSFSKLLGQKNMMPGLLQGVQLIKRDESRHIAYGVFLISRLIAEHKDLWPLIESCMNELFSVVEINQQKNNIPEDARNYSRQQFEKRLTRIGCARNQTLEQVYQFSGEEMAETI